VGTESMMQPCAHGMFLSRTQGAVLLSLSSPGTDSIGSRRHVKKNPKGKNDYFIRFSCEWICLCIRSSERVSHDARKILFGRLTQGPFGCERRNARQAPSSSHRPSNLRLSDARLGQPTHPGRYPPQRDDVQPAELCRVAAPMTPRSWPSSVTARRVAFLRRS
jgi:hypothetical protein